MKKRVITASILVAVLVALFFARQIPFAGLYIFDLAVGVMCIFAALEACNLLTKMGRKCSSIFAGLCPSIVFAGSICVFIFKLNLYFYPIIILSSIVLFALISFFVEIIRISKSKDVKNKSQNKFSASLKFALNNLFVFIYPTVMLSLLIFINRLDSIGGAAPAFNGWLGLIGLIFAFLVPIITDSAAMLGGIALKGPKLIPSVSPNKTVSGAVCGVGFASVVTGGIYLLLNLIAPLKQGFESAGASVWMFLLLGFVASIICQIGDIFESLLKRKAKVKDSGNIFPGHGGFLDRFDSHIFNAPIILAFFLILVLV